MAMAGWNSSKRVRAVLQACLYFNRKRNVERQANPPPPPPEKKD